MIFGDRLRPRFPTAVGSAGRRRPGAAPPTRSLAAVRPSRRATGSPPPSPDPSPGPRPPTTVTPPPSASRSAPPRRSRRTSASTRRRRGVPTAPTPDPSVDASARPAAGPSPRTSRRTHQGARTGRAASRRRVSPRPQMPRRMAGLTILHRRLRLLPRHPRQIGRRHVRRPPRPLRIRLLIGELHDRTQLLGAQRARHAPPPRPPAATPTPARSRPSPAPSAPTRHPRPTDASIRPRSSSTRTIASSSDCRAPHLGHHLATARLQPLRRSANATRRDDRRRRTPHDQIMGVRQLEHGADSARGSSSRTFVEQRISSSGCRRQTV